MTFSGRVQFKQALIKYGLATQRHLSFPKDEKDRIRAKCSWKGFPWFIFASNKTNSDRFQVKTFNNEHICPKRKDNRLVTGVRTANKYGGNPTVAKRSSQAQASSLCEDAR